MFKKLSVLFLSIFTFISVLPLQVYAEDEDLMKYAPSEKSYVMNEYEGILNQIEDYESKIKMRITLDAHEQDDFQELLKVKNDYKDYIYEKKKLTTEQLKEENFTNDQIDAIKNYDGSEGLTLRASPSISATLRLNSFYYKAKENRTYAGATFKGHWNGSPFYKMQDNTAIGITGSKARFARLGSSNYVKHNNGTIYYNTNNKYYSMAGVAYSFGICDVNRKIIKEFSMTYNAIADGKVTVMDYGASYAHIKEGITGVSLSVGVSASGGSLGLSFSIGKKADMMWENTYTKTSYI